MSASPQAPGRYTDDDAEIDIGRYVLALWQHRLIIAGVCIACALLLFLVSMRSRPVYEATAQLLVSRSRIGDTAASQPMTPPGSGVSYQGRLDNRGVAAEIVQAFALDRSLGLNGSSLLAAMSSESNAESNVISIKVRLSDPALAAKVANAFADHAVDLAARLNQKDITTARDAIRSQVDDMAAHLDHAQASLETFRRTAQLDLLQAGMTGLLNHKVEQTTLLLDIASEKARLKSAEEEIAMQPPARSARTVVDVAGALDAVKEQERAMPTAPMADATAADRAKQTPEDRAYRIRSDAISPYVNPVYEILQQQIVSSRTRLAALERRWFEMERLLKLNGAQTAGLAEMYSRQLRMGRLEADYDVAREAYVEASTRYEKVQLQVAAGSARLQVLDVAVPPDGPVSRHGLRNAAIGFAAGLFLSSLFVIASEIVLALGGARSSSLPTITAG